MPDSENPPAPLHIPVLDPAREWTAGEAAGVDLRRHPPQPDFPVAAAGEQVLAPGSEGQTEDVSAVSFEIPEGCARGHIEHPDAVGALPAKAVRGIAAVVGERHAHDLPAVCP